jgi:hypothetical protein
MATKRKHVDFSETQAEHAAPSAAPAPAAVSTGPVIHPSRMAGNAILAKTAGVDAGDPATKKNKVNPILLWSVDICADL